LGSKISPKNAENLQIFYYSLIFKVKITLSWRTCPALDTAVDFRLLVFPKHTAAFPENNLKRIISQELVEFINSVQ